ncbi:MAG: C69 family dipeptidase [Candidatus Heimdallarchaeota archaeon]|nr:C69 family dipeptidase [Candidatus Heimdallarchaeota archaeon]MCK4878846.1 C69 family dipeptidase [Candidatus Heimdallarchaeota archaeon]
MCDTVVALGNSTKDGSIIFGKNSNREPNEVHNIEYIPKEKYKPNSEVKCTYIKIPQVEETYDVLLLKPFWMFGCEMGSNEFGVTIGNEAVWTKEPVKEVGLLGMDVIRLALERSKTSMEALETITSLFEKYGQGGPGKRETGKARFYHNSFIIADPEEAWVLETIDRFWIAEKVKDIRAISNTLSIGNEFDLIQPDLIKYAINQGYCKSEEEFHFSRCFIPSFKIYHVLKDSQERSQFFAKAKERQQCTTSFLLKRKGKIAPSDVMSILRSHNITPEREDNWFASKAKAKSPCQHSTGITVPDQTVGSHVAQLKRNIQVHWVTGASAPCTNIFKPIFMPKPGLTLNLKPGNEFYNPETLWWHHEVLHRLVLQDYQKRLNAYKKERDELEDKYTKQVDVLLANLSSPLSDQDIKKMKSITKIAFEESRDKTEQWIKRINTLPIQKKPNLFYREKWRRLNEHDRIKFD